MASDEIEFQAPASKGNIGGGLSAFKKSLWNPETKQFFGRTGPSWAKITLFYLVFYGLLAAFFAVMLALFFTTVDDRIPSQTGMDSLIKGNPGMSFRPMPDIASTLVKFQQGRPTSYEKYKANIDALLNKYKAEHSKYDYEDCTDGRPEGSLKPCKFELSLLGEDCTSENDYGFYDGAPCMLFKLNKVFGWEPESYDNDTLPEQLVGSGYSAGNVAVTCEGENIADKENLGGFKVYPEEGFLGRFFPYENRPGYQSPLVFVKLNSLHSGVLTQAWCKAWSKNIYHHKNDKAGSAHLELLMD